MVIKGVEVYGIDQIHGNSMYTNDGAVSMIYELELPRKYSVSEEQFDLRCSELDKAFRFFPVNSFVHKQDIIVKHKFDVSKIERDSFLGNDSKKYNEGREFIKHTSLLIFTLRGLGSLEYSYVSNPLKYRKSLHQLDREKLDEFDSTVDRSINVISNIKNTKITPLKEDDLKSLYEKILNGFEATGLYDVNFTEKTFGDDTHFKMLAIHKAEHLPTTFKNIKKSSISTDYQPIYEGFFDGLNEVLDFNHIVNQIIFCPGKEVILKELEERRKEYSKLQKYNEGFKAKFDTLADRIKGFENSEEDLVKSHLNVLVFDKDKEQLNKNFKRIKSHLDGLGVKHFTPSSKVLQNLYLGSIIGREPLLHKDFLFITPLIQAVSMFTHTTVSKDDEQGVYFNDRVTQEPRIVDFWDEDNVYMNARNGIICAETGGGKSVAALTLITQMLDNNVNVTVAEFGRSFEFITKLFKEKSKHIVLRSDTPLGVNPFALKKGELPSEEKKGYLSEIVMKTWRVVEYMNDTHFIVTMDKIINHYYKQVKENHSYEDFYHFVMDGGNVMLYLLEIEEDYFDLTSFKHSCSQFIKGGKYENVFKINEDSKNHIGEKQLVVFELTEIKKDPFLVTLVLLILQETIDTNILADKSRKGILIFDEFAESSTIKDMYTNVDVLQTVSVLYQKIRKENGSVYIIVQDLTQLPVNNYTKSIFANTQVFMMLPSSRAGYLEVSKTLLLTESEAAEMQSIKNNYSTRYPYSMFWLKRGEDKQVFKNELSPYAYHAFQTKGEIWKALNDDFERTQNMETSIINYVNNKNQII